MILGLLSPDFNPDLTQLALSLALRPVFSGIQPDGDRVFDQYSPSNHRVLASSSFTGTSAGTYFSGCTFSLKINEIKLVPVAGLEPTRLFTVPGF
jgi:hypothetical protein